MPTSVTDFGQLQENSTSNSENSVSSINSGDSPVPQTQNEPVSSINPFGAPFEKADYSEKLHERANYINNEVDSTLYGMKEGPRQQLSDMEADKVIELGDNKEADIYFDSEAEASSEIEKRMGRDKAIKFFSKVKNEADRIALNDQKLTARAAAALALVNISESKQGEPEFPELNDSKFIGIANQWIDASLGINRLYSELVETKRKEYRAKWTAAGQNDIKQAQEDFKKTN